MERQNEVSLRWRLVLSSLTTEVLGLVPFLEVPQERCGLLERASPQSTEEETEGKRG